MTRVWASGQFLTVCSRWVSVASGTSMDVSTAAPISRGAITLVRCRAEGVDRQVDLGVDAGALEGQQGAELQDDPLIELLGTRLEGDPGGAVAMEPADVTCAPPGSSSGRSGR